MFLPLLLSLWTAASAVVVPADSITASVVAPDPERPGFPRHSLADAAAAGMRLSELLLAEATLEAEIQRGAFPGAAIAIGRWNRTVVERGIGRASWAADAPHVDPEHTVYDLASLTKVVATTTAVMLLVEDGRLELDAPVRRYVSEFGGGVRDGITIRQLLNHTSGLPASADVWAETPQGSLDRALRTPLVRQPGAGVEYSDIGFVVLYTAAERAAGEPLFRLLDRRVFGPLGMLSTTFLPGADCVRCAPTEMRGDGSPFRGVVHDPIARRLGGIAGNAGLFSTAHDLARFAAMLAQEGELDGVRVLRAETIRQFTQRQPGAGTRALGWDTPSAGGGGAAGLRVSPRSYGHTGFTGTSLWVDPDRGTWVVLVANRTFAPRTGNRMQTIRRTVHDWVASAADAANP